MPKFLVRIFQRIVVFYFGDYRAYLFQSSQIWLYVRIIWGVLKKHRYLECTPEDSDSEGLGDPGTCDLCFC